MILHTSWQLCFFDMVGWKFTLCQYCKKFSSWKKSFLWSRWSPAEGQLIFPFRFYGPKMCQCFKISHIFAAHFSLGLGRCRWGISIEIIWHADKWFPWTRRRFSWAEASLKGIARSGLDWLIDWSQYFPSVFLIQKRTPFLKSLLSVWSLGFDLGHGLWRLYSSSPGLSPLFTSFLALNDECLLPTRELATKQKPRWHRV